MTQNLTNKYFIKNTLNGTYTDVASLFDGLRVLQISNMSSFGKAINVYNAQWVTSNVEDFFITGESGLIVRENVDIKLTFIISRRYSQNQISEEETYDNFIAYIGNTDVWVRSTYYDKQVHCVVNDKFEPKTVKLYRGGRSYILGEITLHCLEKPSNYAPSVSGLYIGFGGDTLTSISTLVSRTYYDTDSVAGTYTMRTPSTVQYLWICTRLELTSASMGGFEMPLEGYVVVDNDYCYRSSAPFVANTNISFTLE